MQLNDKFGIVIQENSRKQAFNKELFFENLIKNNKKIYLSSFAKKRLEGDNTELNKIVSQNLEDHVKQLRKNLRNSLRRNNMNGNMVQSVINILNDFSYKILSIEYFITSTNSIREYYNNMLNNIIGDPILKEVLKNDIMNINNIKSTKYLLSKIKNLNKDFYDGWCIPFISSSIDSYSNDIDITEYPIPKNLMMIEKINKKFLFLDKYKSKFSFLQDKTIFNSFIQNFFKTLFTLPQHVSINVFSQIITINSSKIKNMISTIDNNIKEIFVASYINNVLEYYINTSSLEDIINLYISTQEIIIKEIEYMNDFIGTRIFKHMNDNNIFLEYLNIILRNLDNNKVDNDISKLNVLFKIIAKSDDKNLFGRLYHKELVKRLLVNNITLARVNYEKNIANIIGRKVFGVKHFSKINKIIEDMVRTFKVNNYISDNISNIDDWNIINTSYNAWGSNVFDIPTKFSLESGVQGRLGQVFAAYSAIYNKMYSDRYLNWYLHTGSVDFKYKTNKGTVELHLLPIQGLVLELFSTVDTINLVQLFNLDSLSSYSRNEKEKVLDIFIENNILLLTGYKISINMNMESCKFDLINQFFVSNNLVDKWEEETKVEIANNKVDVIMTKINHHVKINQKSRDELYQECSNINVFNIEDDLFDKALAYMMKMEYISLDNTTNKYSKMLY